MHKAGGKGVRRGENKKLPEDESPLHGLVHHLVWHFYNKSVQNREFGIILNANDSLKNKVLFPLHICLSMSCIYACARMRAYAALCKETARKVKMTPRGHAKGVTGSERLLLWYLKIFHLLLLLYSVSNKLRTVVSYII